MAKETLFISLILATILAGNRASAGWTEITDAGDLPTTAQEITGIGVLDTISGTHAAETDVDMYKIYICDPQNFSARAYAFDGQLFLFDSSGYGVLANDDSIILDPYLPAGCLSPTTPAGIYYLAISIFDMDPYSSTGLIFPTFPSGNLYGPTGPGGGQPISYWSGTLYKDPTPYSIELTGVCAVPQVTAVPAPTAFLLCAIGAACLTRTGRGRML